MYAAPEGLKRRLGVIYDAIYTFDEDAASDLAGAQAELDGCIAKRYRVPVTAPAAVALLQDWTLTLAEERAYARTAGAQYAEKVSSRVAQVRKYLDMILAGTFQLIGAEENPDVPGAGISLVAGNEPDFTREKMEGY